MRVKHFGLCGYTQLSCIFFGLFSVATGDIEVIMSEKWITSYARFSENESTVILPFWDRAPIKFCVSPESYKTECGASHIWKQRERKPHIHNSY